MKKHLFSVIIMCISLTSYAQTQSTPISQEDIQQGEKFISAYFSPMSRSLGSSLNNGWYTTAKPHSLGGFDLTVTFNTVIIPDEAKSFNILQAGGTTFISNSSEAATVLTKATLKAFFSLPISVVLGKISVKVNQSRKFS